MGSSLAARLEADEREATVTAFPDGSVDYFAEVFVGGERIEDRTAVGERVTTGRTAAFTLQNGVTEPGGHVVNTAEQSALLGEAVTLVGHLDHPVFDDLPVETVSMGAPARVTVAQFDDGDVIVADTSGDIDDWSFAAFRAAVGDRLVPLLSADVVCCANWTTFDALPNAVREIAATGVDGETFVFDPGDLTGRSARSIRRLLDALGDLTESYDIVLTANEQEIRTLARAVVGGEPGGRERALSAVRSVDDLTAVVCHETDAALAATSEGIERVSTPAVDPVRNTGGGDRFDAGLAFALARGWPWADALRLGNACASRYVATGESGTPAQLAAFIRERW